MSSAEPDRVSPLAADVESRPGLLRVLGPGMAIAVVVGNVIGSGIFAKPGQIAADGGDFRLIITAWITGGVLCFLGALCFAELAVMLPQAGGLYVYLREAYGRTIAFLFGWTEFLLARPASIGALSMFFVGQLVTVTGWQLKTMTQIMLGMFILWGMAWVNVIGVIWGGRTQLVTTIIKAGFVAAVAALPFCLQAAGQPSVSLQNLQSTVATEQIDFGSRFALVLLAVMWAYNGWHGITPVAEEVREPRRNIPLALFGGIGLLIVLYVSANVAYHAVLPMDQVKQAGDQVANEMAGALIGPIGAKLISIGIMVSVIGAINSNMLLGPRISFAMGRDDVFVRQLGRVHVNYRTPASAIVVQAMMATVLIAVTGLYVQLVDRGGADGPVTATPGAADVDSSAAIADNGEDQASAEASKTLKAIFELLTNFVVFGSSIFYMLAVSAVFVLRRRRPDWERPYRTLGYPVVPIVYLCSYTWFLYQIFRGQMQESAIGIGLILAGLPFYFAWRSWAARHPDVVHDGQ